MADINKRMNYFDRQFLRAVDFIDEQAYHLDRHRRHNRLLHTSGLAGPNDLRVTGKRGQARITVDAGTAIDQQGSEIVLSVSRELHLSETPEITEPGTYAIYVELIEALTDPSTDPGVEEGWTRTTETPKFRFEKLVADRREYPPLTLAAITVDAEKNLTETPNLSMRKLAGTLGGLTGKFDTVTASSLTLTQDGQETVHITSNGAIESPMWQVRLSLNERSKPVQPDNFLFDTEKHFDAAGGSLLIFASISVLPTPGGLLEPGKSFIIGIDIELNGVKQSNFPGTTPSVPGSAHKPKATVTTPLPPTTVTTTLWIPNIEKKTHKLKLKANANTSLTEDDFYSITILELPFTPQQNV